MDDRVKGIINAVTEHEKPRRRVVSSGMVVFSTINNGFGSVLTHIGKEHIQVVVTVRGKEVFSQIWR